MTPESPADARREDLAFLAATNAARNRPVRYLLLAAAALAVALGWLLWVYAGRAAARAALARERTLARDVLVLADQLKELKEAGKDETLSRVGEPETRIRTRIRDAGTRAGVENVSQTPLAVPERVVDGVRRMKWTYEQRADSLESLLRWVQLSTQEVPGLEVFALTIRPESQVWYLKVTFARWERAGAAAEGARP